MSFRSIPFFSTKMSLPAPHRSFFKLLPRSFILALVLAALPALRADVIGVQEPAAYSSRFDNPGADIVYDTTTDAQGNVYVVGRFAAVATGEATEMNIDVFRDREDENTGRPGLATTTTLIGRGNAFVVKYDRDGNIVWKRSAGDFSNLSMGATGVTVDPAGNVFVTGFFSGTIALGNLTLTGNVRSNSNFANTIPASQYNAQTNAFVAMLDRDGVWQWARQFECALFTSTKTNTTNLGTDLTGGVVQVSTQPFPNLLSPVGDNQGRGIVRDSDGSLYIKMILATGPNPGNAGADRILWLRTAGLGIVAGATTDAAGASQNNYGGTAFIAKLAATPPVVG